MSIGVGIFLITIGAILRFGITVELSGLDIEAVGVILMIVGICWLVISFVVMRRRAGERQDAYQDREPPPV